MPDISIAMIHLTPIAFSSTIGILSLHYETGHQDVCIFPLPNLNIINLSVLCMYYVLPYNTHRPPFPPLKNCVENHAMSLIHSCLTSYYGNKTNNCQRYPFTLNLLFD